MKNNFLYARAAKLPKFLPSIVMAAMLLMMTAVANTPAKAHALNSSACNCVIFRLDDVQDFWIVPVQAAIIDKFVERNQTLDIALIMNWVGNDPVIVSKVREASATGLIEMSLHGWNHVDYSKLSLQQQHDTLKAANAKMQDLFGRKSAIFVTPYNAYDEGTLKAMNQLGLKVISSEFDTEIGSIYNSESPNSPDNKVYKSIAGSDIKDQHGIYHLPQTIGFYTYDSDPPTKTPLSRIEKQIGDTIASYGYAVVTLHPQDFTEKDAANKPTTSLSQPEIKDLDTLITWIRDNNYPIKTFSDATHVSLPPIIDNVPPNITPPPDKAVVSSAKLTHVDLGRPIVSDNADPNPVVINDAAIAGFPQGTTKVTWTAADAAGNIATAIQYVTVAPTADVTKPTVTISMPAEGAAIRGEAAAATVQVKGTASDSESGVKVVEVRTNYTGYKAARQETQGSWSNWTATVQVRHSGSTEIIARATDFFGNQQWARIHVTVSLGGNATASLQQTTSAPDAAANRTIMAAANPIGPPVAGDNNDNDNDNNNNNNNLDSAPRILNSLSNAREVVASFKRFFQSAN